MRGDRVRQLRREKGLTQTQLAEQVGVAQGTISSIESGGIEPSIDVLSRLVRALQTSSDYLLGLDESESDLEPAALALV